MGPTKTISRYPGAVPHLWNKHGAVKLTSVGRSQVRVLIVPPRVDGNQNRHDLYKNHVNAGLDDLPSATKNFKKHLTNVENCGIINV